MDQEKQRIAIANVCGLKDVRLMKSSWLWRGDALVYGNETLVPNYLTDLNAMHEAEKLFTNPHSDKHIRQSYRNWLHKLNRGQVWSATAPQRAEAFLRTLNLWEE
jgi:hypothetical protein